MTQQIPTEEQIKSILTKQLQAGEITREQAAQKMSNYRKLVSGQQTQTPVAQQQRVLSQPDPTIRQRVAGDLQTIGRVAGGALAEPLAGISGLLVGGVTGDVDQAAGAVEAVQSFPQKVIPLNEAGQRRTAQLGYGVEKAIDAARFPVSGLTGIVASVLPGNMTGAEAVKAVQDQGISDVLGDSVLEMTQSPELATLAYTLPSAAIEAMGIKGARNLKGQTFIGAENAVLSTNMGKALQQASPSVQQLKKRSGELYKAVDDAGVRVANEDYLDFAINLNDKLRKAGLKDQKYAKELSPKSLAAIQFIEDQIADGMTFTDIDSTRKIANVAALDSNPLEQSLGKIIKQEIDDFLDSQAVKLGETGNADAAANLKQARNLWQRARKTETIDEIMQNATSQASGFENGLRIGFRSLLKNDKKLAGFTVEEQKLMREIVEGTNVSNTFKRLGKLGIGEGQQTNMLLGYLGGAGGYAVGGPFGAVTIPALGTVSGKLATRLTANKSMFLKDVTAAGTDSRSIVNAYMKNTPAKERNVTELTELLLTSGADIKGMKKGPLSDLVNDALFAAEYLSDVGMANFIEAPAFINAIEREQQE